MDQGNNGQGTGNTPSAAGETDATKQGKRLTVQERVAALLKAPTQAELDALRMKHSSGDPDFEQDVAVISTKSGYHVAVLVPPPKAAVDEFRRRSMGTKHKERALELFFRSVCVYPAPAQVELALKLQPLLADALGGEALKLAGMAEEAEGND